MHLLRRNRQRTELALVLLHRHVALHMEVLQQHHHIEDAHQAHARHQRGHRAHAGVVAVLLVLPPHVEHQHQIGERAAEQQHRLEVLRIVAAAQGHRGAQNEERDLHLEQRLEPIADSGHLGCRLVEDGEAWGKRKINMLREL